MFTSRFTTKAITGTSLVLLASAAFAHPKLIPLTPADRAEVITPAKIGLRLSETLTIQFSEANLVTTEVPGMSGHNPMKADAKVFTDDSARTMVIASAQPLATGTYKVEWHVASPDIHPITENFIFKAR